MSTIGRVTPGCLSTQTNCAAGAIYADHPRSRHGPGRGADPGAQGGDAELQVEGDPPTGLTEHLAQIAEMVLANMEAAAEKAAAAEAHAEAIMEWTACVATNAAGHADEAVPKIEPFDPKTGPVDCGPKPTPPDGAVDEEPDTLSGPPEGTPQGPPEGTPQGPPAP
ncbi:MAG: hypothetical protein ACRDJ9_30045 [Dehalococcoidia bacterium]